MDAVHGGGADGRAWIGVGLLAGGAGIHTHQAGEAVRRKKCTRKQRAWWHVKRHPGLRLMDIAEALGVSRGNLWDVLAELRTHGHLRREGKGPNAVWFVDGECPLFLGGVAEGSLQALAAGRTPELQMARLAKAAAVRGIGAPKVGYRERRKKVPTPRLCALQKLWGNDGRGMRREG
jgi:hypothetical protein